MLSGSTIARAVLLLVAAAGAVALAALYYPGASNRAVPDAERPSEPAVAAPSTPPAATDPASGTPPTDAAERPAAEAPSADPATAGRTVAEPPAADPPAPSAPAPARRAEATAPAPEPAPAQSPPERAAPPGAPIEALDINTASAAELDRLGGGGPIGRLIVKRRPYRTIEDLVRKKLVSRARFEKIKAQVTVR